MSGQLSLAIKHTLYEHRWILIYIAAYIVAYFLLLLSFNLPLNVSLFVSYPGFMGMSVMATIIFMSTRAVYLSRKNESLFVTLWKDLKENYLKLDRGLALLLMWLVMPLFIATFMAFKIEIPVLIPYYLDPDLMHWDAALHGGYQPWELLQPLLGHPLITKIIDYLYALWLLLMYAVVFWQITAKASLLRMQFLLTFVLSWSIIGSLMAMLLSSAGPVYYGSLLGLDDVNNPYAPLMQYLYSANEQYEIWALKVQGYLWDNYQQQQLNIIFNGISAMPSMHIASTSLLALIGWHTNRWLGIFFTAYTIIMLIGSIHLAWHYALDGYIGIILTVTIWYLVGKFLKHHYN